MTQRQNLLGDEEDFVAWLEDQAWHSRRATKFAWRRDRAG
jgi:hypothetical protein